MARPPRNTVDYFPHPVIHGKKMSYLRSKYGNDAYVVWFMSLEQLGRAEYHFLDLQDEVQLMYLSSELKVTQEILLEVIDVLVKFDEFDSALWKHRILFNQKYVDSIADAYKKRNNDCINKEVLINLLVSKGRLKVPLRNPKQGLGIPNEGMGNLKGVENPQSKVEKSKLKKSIEENITMSELAASDGPLNDIEEVAISFWELVRSNMREQNINSTDLQKQKKSSWVEPVRLAIEKDGRSHEELQKVWNYLKNEQPGKDGFMWKTHIRSGQKLREKFESLLLAAKNPRNQSKIGNNLNSMNHATEILRGHYANK
jgi:hypothetical protein